MLEIQVYIESGDYYESLDLFQGEGVDLNIPIYPFSDISKRLVNYTDEFSLPATDRNLSYLSNDDTERYKCRLKNNTVIVNGFLSVNNITSYIPESKISVNFVSIVKYIVDKMREIPFAHIFKDNSGTDIPQLSTPNGTIINDGSYGFYLNENGIPHNDGLLYTAVNNQVSDQYSNNDFPIYAMDSKLGSRSIQPVFNIEFLLSSMFGFFNQSIDTSDSLSGIRNYNQAYIKIPTSLKSDGELGGEHLRDVVYKLAEDGWIADQDNTYPYNGVIAFNSDLSLFKPQQEISFKEEVFNKTSLLLEEINTIYNCHTPQETGEYEVTASGTKDDYVSSIFVYCDGVSNGTSSEVEIPSSEITIISGRVAPSIGFYYYDELVYHFEIDTNVFYNKHDVQFGNSGILGKIKATYGDAIRCKIGFYVDDLTIEAPTMLDAMGYYSGSIEFKSKNGFYKDGNSLLLMNNFEYEDTANGVLTNHNYMYLHNQYNKATQSINITLTNTEDSVISRYGDKVLMYNSYKSNEDLKIYDVLKSIIDRFGLSIKEMDNGDLKFLKEHDFYNDNNPIILENRVSRGVLREFKKNDVKSISITNKQYGNINDSVSKQDEVDGITIYDINKYVVNDSNFNELNIDFNSSLQNNFVYGKRIKSTEIDGWDLLKLENNTALWNLAVNEKIETSSLPITFGDIEQTGMDSFRIPRSVFVYTEYDENANLKYSIPPNYLNATQDGIEASANIMVVEHTLFQSTNGNYFPVLSYIDDFNMSNKDGTLNTSSVMYQYNFKDYFDRNSSDAVNLEIDAYVTNEEIHGISNGSKIYLFGDIYKPISISNIQFEKGGSICTIVMTKQKYTDDGIRFDSNNDTFDSNNDTFDSM